MLKKTEMWTSSPNQFCAGNFDNCKNWFSMVVLHQDQTLLWFLLCIQTLVWELAQNNCCDGFLKFWFKPRVTITKKTLFSHHLKILIHFLCPNNISEVPPGDSVKKRATPPFRYRYTLFQISVFFSKNSTFGKKNCKVVNLILTEDFEFKMAKN